MLIKLTKSIVGRQWYCRQKMMGLTWVPFVAVFRMCHKSQSIDTQFGTADVPSGVLGIKE